MLDSDDRTRFLTCTALDAVIDVGGGGLSLHELIDVGGANGNALAYPLAFVVVDLDDYAELLALPFPDVCHPSSPGPRLGAAGVDLELLPKRLL